MDWARIALDLLMRPANGRFNKIGIVNWKSYRGCGLFKRKYYRVMRMIKGIRRKKTSSTTWQLRQEITRDLRISIHIRSMAPANGSSRTRDSATGAMSNHRVCSGFQQGLAAASRFWRNLWSTTDSWLLVSLQLLSRRLLLTLLLAESPQSVTSSSRKEVMAIWIVLMLYVHCCTSFSPALLPLGWLSMRFRAIEKMA